MEKRRGSRKGRPPKGPRGLGGGDRRGESKGGGPGKPQGTAKGDLRERLLWFCHPGNSGRDRGSLGLLKLRETTVGVLMGGKPAPHVGSKDPDHVITETGT